MRGDGVSVGSICCQSVHRILTNEIIAAKSKIFTKRSSNCSNTSCQIVFPSSVGSSKEKEEEEGEE